MPEDTVIFPAGVTPLTPLIRSAPELILHGEIMVTPAWISPPDDGHEEVMSVAHELLAVNPRIKVMQIKVNLNNDEGITPLRIELSSKSGAVGLAECQVSSERCCAHSIRHLI